MHEFLGLIQSKMRDAGELRQKSQGQSIEDDPAGPTFGRLKKRLRQAGGREADSGDRTEPMQGHHRVGE